MQRKGQGLEEGLPPPRADAQSLGAALCFGRHASGRAHYMGPFGHAAAPTWASEWNQPIGSSIIFWKVLEYFRIFMNLVVPFRILEDLPGSPIFFGFLSSKFFIFLKLSWCILSRAPNTFSTHISTTHKHVTSQIQ